MFVIRAVVVSLFVLLIGGFWFFQVIEHGKFQEMAENNHQRELLAAGAARACCSTATGRVLVENRPSFNVSIVRAAHRRSRPDDPAARRRWPASTRRGCARSVDRHRREPSYRPIVVIEDASLAQVAAITARRLDFELPDVVVQEVPTRQYPTDETRRRTSSATSARSPTRRSPATAR